MKYNSEKAEDILKAIEDDIAQVNKDLANLIGYAIDYYERIKKKYGKGKERKTELRNFEVIEATMVAAANEKLYVRASEKSSINFVDGLLQPVYVLNISAYFFAISGE